MRSHQGLRGPVSNRIDFGQDRRQATVRALGLPGNARGSVILTALCTAVARLLKLPYCVLGVTGISGVEVAAAFGVDDSILNSTGPRSSFFAWPWTGANAVSLVVEDLSKDVRFADKYWIRLLNAKYYVAMPLLASNDVVIGFLVGIDTQAPTRPAGHYHALCNFAELAARELEGDFYNVLEDLLDQRPMLLREPQECQEAVILCDVTSRWWNFEFADRNARKLHPTIKLDGSSFWSVFRPVKGAKNHAQEQAAQDIKKGSDFVLHVQLRDQRSSQEHMSVRFRSARGCYLSNTGTTLGVPRTANMDCMAPVTHTHYFGIISDADAEGPREQTLLGPEFTMFNQELFSENHWQGSPRVGAKAAPTGMSDIKLGVGCLSSASTIIYRSRWNKLLVAVKVVTRRPEQCVKLDDSFMLAPPDAPLHIRLLHPNVVTTYKVVVQPKVADSNGDTHRKGDSIVEASYVREWCSFGELQALMDQGGLIEADRETPKLKLILAVAKDVATGLRYLHDRNIVGASLHPSRILLVKDEDAPASEYKPFTAKISSLADAVAAEHPVHVALPAPGSIRHSYAAPELATKGTLSPAADVFAFGRLLWDMYAGSRLDWQSSNRKALGHVHPEAGITGGDFLGFEALLKYCLASKPQARPSLAAVCDMLDMLRDGGLEEAAVQAAMHSAMLTVPASPFAGHQRGNPRASLDQARAAVEGLFSSKSGKQLLPAKSSSSFVSVKSGKQLLSRKSSSSVVESVDEPDQVNAVRLASKKSLAARLSSKTPLRKASAVPRDEPEELASQMSDKLGLEGKGQPEAPRKGLTSFLFGKKLREVLKSPNKLRTS